MAFEPSGASSQRTSKRPFQLASICVVASFHSMETRMIDWEKLCEVEPA
jgi:hypothetical protein